MSQLAGYITHTQLIIEDGREYYIAVHPEFNGKCKSFGDTEDEAKKRLADTLKKVKKIYLENGWKLPAYERASIVLGGVFTAVPDARELQWD